MTVRSGIGQEHTCTRRRTTHHAAVQACFQVVHFSFKLPRRSRSIKCLQTLDVHIDQLHYSLMQYRLNTDQQGINNVLNHTELQDAFVNLLPDLMSFTPESDPLVKVTRGNQTLDMHLSEKDVCNGSSSSQKRRISILRSSLQNRKICPKSCPSTPKTPREQMIASAPKRTPSPIIAYSSPETSPSAFEEPQQGEAFTRAVEPQTNQINADHSVTPKQNLNPVVVLQNIDSLMKESEQYTDNINIVVHKSSALLEQTNMSFALNNNVTKSSPTSHHGLVTLAPKPSVFAQLAGVKPISPKESKSLKFKWHNETERLKIAAEASNQESEENKPSPVNAIRKIFKTTRNTKQRGQYKVILGEYTFIPSENIPSNKVAKIRAKTPTKRWLNYNNNKDSSEHSIAVDELKVEAQVPEMMFEEDSDYDKNLQSVLSSTHTFDLWQDKEMDELLMQCGLDLCSFNIETPPLVQLLGHDLLPEKVENNQSVFSDIFEESSNIEGFFLGPQEVNEISDLAKV